MPIHQESIHAAFEDEYARLKRDGLEQLIALPLDHLLYRLYRAGYMRGHGDRSRDVVADDRAIRRVVADEGAYVQIGQGRMLVNGVDVLVNGVDVLGSGGAE